MMGVVYDRKIRGFMLLLLCAAGLAAGCATPPPVARKEPPPVLTQAEVLRPYQKAGVLEVRRTRYGSPDDVTPEDYAWAYDALRQEASRIGADAVIFPEVRVELGNYYFFPKSEILAKGIAIRFE